jgi:phage I-like protein
MTTTPQPIPFVEGQSELWCLLCPFGEFPGKITSPDGASLDVLQICDNKAFEQVIAAFQPEVLVDFEHRSEVPKLDSDTVAAGWIQELRIGANGLECRNKLTDLGADDLRNRRRRFLSPVWHLDADGRPTRIKSVALTNTPNIRGEPVLNKESLSPAALAANPKQERSPEMDLKTIAAALGLPETATADEFMAAVKAAMDGKATLEKRVAELEQTALNTEAQAVVAANKGRIAAPDKFVGLYVANKDFALKVLETLATPAGTVANKADGAKPAIAGGVAANKLTAYRAMPAGKEKDAFLAANKAELLRLEAEDRS